MVTLADLKAQHQKTCLRCGGFDPFHEHVDDSWCMENPLIAALIAAKLEDEARMAELETQLSASREVAVQGIGKEMEMRSALTAKQQAHAETKRQLEEVDKLVCCWWGSAAYMTPEERDHVIRAALARQASINRPTDEKHCPNCARVGCPGCDGEETSGPYTTETPTDDRGEGEK